MQHQSNPLYTINDFFEQYSAAVERKDTKFLANCYALPCSFISDSSSQVYSHAAKLEGLINQGKRFYAVHGIAHAKADIRSKHLITNSIVRVVLRWNYTDNTGKTVYDCDYYYLLKLNDERAWKIEVAVSVNEQERIERLGIVP